MWLKPFYNLTPEYVDKNVDFNQLLLKTHFYKMAHTRKRWLSACQELILYIKDFKLKHRHLSL